MHIGIAGNIGCGKTTLTTMLAKHYGWTPKFESVSHNPYLEDYYKDIERWSYNLETYFLAQRFQDLLEISKSEDVIIQDRTILEGVHIFVANNKAMGNLSDRDFDTYMQLFNLMMSMVREPDLLIYLKSSVPHLVSQIQKRGREYEKSISIEYLNNMCCKDKCEKKCTEAECAACDKKDGCDKKHEDCCEDKAACDKTDKNCCDAEHKAACDGKCADCK